MLRIAAVSLLGLALFYLSLRTLVMPEPAALAVELAIILVGLRLAGEISAERLRTARALFRRGSSADGR